MYQQPYQYKAAFILGKLGMDATGVPDDIFYNNALKVVGIGGAAVCYAFVVPPLITPDAGAKAAKSNGQAKKRS